MAEDKKSFIENVTSTFNINTAKSTAMHTNVTIENAAKQVTKNIAAAGGSQLGIPQVSAVTNAIVSLNGPNDTLYATSPLSQRYTLPWAPLNDFRTRYGINNIGTSFNTRLDGVALLQRRPSARAAAYAALSAAPGGVYSVFGLDSFGVLGYGWGDHGNPDAFRNDFTRQSHLATKWSDSRNKWVPVKNPLAIITPFRGDKVNVIDYKKEETLNRIYDYRPSDSVLGARIDNFAKVSLTQDFIKFFFTGPKLAPHTKDDDTVKDDVIVFRATIGSISDQFQPSWTPVQLIGRADPNYHYSGYSRDISLDFTVYATDRDEMKPIWRKLNALAGYTAPDYSGTGIGFKAPWMRVTIGDLFYQVPVVISSLSYTLGDNESPWEINIEGDPDMMEAPMKVQVSIAFHLIGDWLPQKGGQFYSLSKRFDKFGSMVGSDNWLSDTKQIDDDKKRRGGEDLDTIERKRREEERVKKQKGSLDSNNPNASGTLSDVVQRSGGVEVPGLNVG
jgi:hypothetical protein